MELANIDDVTAAIGRPLTEEEIARACFLLKQLSAKFLQEARAAFEVTEYTHRVKVNRGHARPPRTPLVAVTRVVDDQGASVTWSLGHGFVSVPLTSDQFVVITYTAGHETVPDIVRGCIADEARRILTIDVRAATGQTQSSVTAGPFTEAASFATHVVGAQAMLSPDAIAIARAYRPRRSGNLWVAA